MSSRQLSSPRVRSRRRDLVRRHRWSLFAVLALGALAVAVYARHILHGGFYLDDWSNGAATLLAEESIQGPLEHFAALTEYRPVLIAYVPATFWAFGTHMSLHIAWSVTLLFAVAALLFSVTRLLGLARWHAFALAGLTVVYPWYDGARLWSTASMASFAIALVLAGLLAALHGLERRQIRWHVLAVVLFTTSILTYELCLALVPCLGLLYVLHSGLRPALYRWALDIGVALACAGWVVTQSPRATENDLGDLLGRSEDITRAGATVLGRTALPVGDQRTALALVAMVAVAALAVVARRKLRARGALVDTFLAVGGFGVLVMAVGWALFIPADPYYTPSLFGFTNRVNALAGFGAVLVVYATLGLVGSLLAWACRSGRGLATGATLAGALALGVSYTVVLDRHIGHWTDAFELEMGGLGQMKGRFPDLPQGSTVFAAGYPAYKTLGVPVWATSWDLNGAVQLQYDDPTLRAYPVVEGTAVTCEDGGVRLAGGGYDSFPPAPYGSAILLDLGTGRNATPATRGECSKLAGRFLPGPLYMSVDY